MGNVKSAPKTPKTQIVYVTQPVYTSPVSSGTGSVASTVSSSTSNSSSTATQGEEEKQTSAQKREASLLSRSRSRLGTILTGFRGILAPVNETTQRKKLLGE